MSSSMMPSAIVTAHRMVGSVIPDMVLVSLIIIQMHKAGYAPLTSIVTYPAKLPWCGDFVQTCIRLGLPDEPFPGDLGANPYWARNWMLLGKETPLTYGAVVVFSRDGGGHVGFCVGGDASTVAVLGGNQSNTVSIARLSRSRLLGARWPSTFPARPIILPSPAGAMSHNEA